MAMKATENAPKSFLPTPVWRALTVERMVGDKEEETVIITGSNRWLPYGNRLEVKASMSGYRLVAVDRALDLLFFYPKLHKSLMID